MVPVGKKLARDLYTNGGELLLPQGTVLKPSHLLYLSKFDYHQIFILEEEEENYEIKLVHSMDEVDSDVKKQEGLLSVAFVNATEKFKRIMSDVINGHIIKKSEVEETMDIIFPEVIRTNNIMRCLQTIRDKDEYTFQHSVSVSVIAIKLGQNMEMSENQLINLGIAGLMHDLGKAMVPASILHKPTHLSVQECQEMQKHPLYGYRLVKEIPFHDKKILNAVLQHHERQDGKGYPLRSTSNDIDPFSKVVAVADVFDALTSERYYRPRFNLLKAIDEIIKETTGHLDPVITRCLTRYIMNIVPGEAVKLSDGQMATVVIVNESEPMRPLVKTAERFIDLSREREISLENRV